MQTQTHRGCAGPLQSSRRSRLPGQGWVWWRKQPASCPVHRNVHVGVFPIFPRTEASFPLASSDNLFNLFRTFMDYLSQGCCFPVTALTNYHKLSGLKTIEIPSLAALESKISLTGQNPGVARAEFPLKTLAGNPFFASPSFCG